MCVCVPVCRCVCMHVRVCEYVRASICAWVCVCGVYRAGGVGPADPTAAGPMSADPVIFF